MPSSEEARSVCTSPMSWRRPRAGAEDEGERPGQQHRQDEPEQAGLAPGEDRADGRDVVLPGRRGRTDRGAHGVEHGHEVPTQIGTTIAMPGRSQVQAVGSRTPLRT